MYCKRLSSETKIIHMASCSYNYFFIFGGYVCPCWLMIRVGVHSTIPTHRRTGRSYPHHSSIWSVVGQHHSLIRYKQGGVARYAYGLAWLVAKVNLSKGVLTQLIKKGCVLLCNSSSEGSICRDVLYRPCHLGVSFFKGSWFAGGGGMCQWNTLFQKDNLHTPVWYVPSWRRSPNFQLSRSIESTNFQLSRSIESPTSYSLWVQQSVRTMRFARLHSGRCISTLYWFSCICRRGGGGGGGEKPIVNRIFMK